MRLKVSRLSIEMNILLLLLLAVFFCPESLAQNPGISEGPADEVPNLKQQEVIPDGGILTLRKVISLALQYNPDLKASSWGERAMEGRLIQAGLLPNPEIEVETENFGGSGIFRGFDAAETTVQLSQLIELGGKRAKRSASAAFSRDLAGWDYRVRSADVLADAAVAFVDVLSAQERVTLMKELLHLAEAVFSTTSERVKAGKISPVEEIKAKVEKSERQIDLDRTVYDLQAARRRLSGTWGGTAPAFDHVRGDLEAMSSIPPLEDLEALISQNPDVARWATAIQQHIAHIEVEKARAIPDLTVNLGARRHNEMDATAFVMGISIPIPLFDRNQGATLEARDRLSKAREEARAVELRVINTLAETYQDLSKAFMETSSLRTHVLPAAQAAFEATREGYRLGKFDYLDMLDAQRTLVGAKVRHLEALTAYHQARTRLERLIGMNMEGIPAAFNTTSNGDRS